MVVVQIWPYNLGKPFFKKIQIKQINYVISSTNKRKVFLERLNKSNNIFERFSSWGKHHNNKREKKWSKKQKGAQKIKVLISWQNFN